MFAKFLRKILWIFIFAFASLFLSSNLTYANTLITESSISEDTTWTKSGSPYIITNSIAIFEGATLTIEPGVEVKFEKGKGISVFGKIVALGKEGESIYFTSNADDSISNTDDYELCAIEEYDEEGNLIKKDECEYFDFDEPASGDWAGIYFENNSEKSIFKETAFNYAVNTLTLFRSSINLEYVNISNSKNGIIMYDSSVGDFDHFSTNKIDQESMILFNNSFINFNYINIEEINNRTPIAIYNNSSFSGKYLNINAIYGDNLNEAIIVFNGSNLVLENINLVNCPRDACITLFDASDFTGDSSLINIKNAVFNSGAGNAILSFSTSSIVVNITNSVFKDFLNSAIVNYGANISYNIANNFWDDATGPYNDPANLLGTGETIAGYNLEFTPWLIADPFLECETDCYSNVLFLPGMQGSRLYESNDSKDKELWFSTKDDNQKQLFLDEEGKSINELYTKNDTRNNGEKKETGIIDEAKVDKLGLVNLNIYESFINKLRSLKDEKVINDYSLVPYDWRLSLEDIIHNGKTFGNKNENLSYLERQDFEESFIFKQLESLAASSKSGKVTIVAHSNGGLVTKALLNKLQNINHPLYDKIDKIILVAVPQIGTPEAMIALLYGTGIGPKKIIMSQETSRAFGENMPTLYNLLPRQSYFDLVPQDQKINNLANFTEYKDLKDITDKYGLDINSYQEFSDFLLGEEGREKPELYDTSKLNIANEYLYSKAKLVYEMLDNWTPPKNTKIIQVGGWGMNTKTGLEYKTYKSLLGLGKKYLSHKVKETINGDGTVVLPSSLYMKESENVEKWYVNLDAHNLKSLDTIIFVSADHANILEIPNLLSFVDYKIKNKENTFSDPENIIVKNIPTVVSKNKLLKYFLHSPLYLGVFDSTGKYTGRDEKGNIKNEIPGVEYEQIGEVQSLSIPVELAHTITLYGYEDGVFALELDEFLNDKYSNNQLFQGIPTGSKTVAKLVFEGENSLSNLKLLVDQARDGEFELEYLPEKEEKVLEVKNEVIPAAVVLPQFINQILPSIPQVLGVTTEEVKILEEELNNQILKEKPKVNNTKIETSKPLDIKEMINTEKTEVINPKKEEIIKEEATEFPLDKKVENKPKNNKTSIILSIIFLFLIGLKLILR